jgi:hypothetical protein
MKEVLISCWSKTTAFRANQMHIFSMTILFWANKIPLGVSLNSLSDFNPSIVPAPSLAVHFREQILVIFLRKLLPAPRCHLIHHIVVDRQKWRSEVKIANVECKPSQRSAFSNPGQIKPGDHLSTQKFPLLRQAVLVHYHPSETASIPAQFPDSHRYRQISQTRTPFRKIQEPARLV